MVELKNTHGKKNVLGQFFTPKHICEQILSKIKLDDDSIYVEPSFGSGNFLDELSKNNVKIYGVELDENLYKEYKTNDKNITLLNKNFYDFRLSDIKEDNKKLVFIGNPPYRTPAYSLSTHRPFIKKLCKKYNVQGIREEAIFFILYTIDIILSSKKDGEIHYILPKSIFTNNSKFFTNWKCVIKSIAEITNVMSIKGTDFDNVFQDLICISMMISNTSSTNGKIKVDGIDVDIDDFLCLNDDSIPFQKIFKKTYCGSVPCESILMSVSKEPKENFKNRLCKIISTDNLNKKELYDLLQYDGKFHLKVFSKDYSDDMVQKKLNILLSYVENIKEKKDILKDFQNIDNYKEIQGRNEVLYYFRCEKLKKHKNFVYDINPNPCPSFYFTGNPSSNSGDYFGYCSYDVNRNLCPGAIRTVPLKGIENNLTDFFKNWWKSNTDEPFENVFEYLIYISKTEWYKNKKKNNKRFYFCIPKTFIPKEKRK